SGKRRAHLLSISRGGKNEIVLISLRLMSICLACVVISYILQTRNLQFAIRRSNGLLLFRCRYDPAIGWICDNRCAVRASPVSREKSGQHVKRDVDRCAPYERAVADNGNSVRK